MPRRTRAATGGYVFHVLNRAVARRTLFELERDYRLVLTTLGEAQDRVPIRILSYCLMPTHWHLVLWPRDDGQLSKFMHWFTLTHTRRWHGVAESVGTGPIYQGRFKSFPVFTDRHLLTVLRYVERNAQEAGLVTRARDWKWSSLWQRARCGQACVCLSEWPVALPADWIDTVERSTDGRERQQLERSVRRGTPFGPVRWQRCVADELGLESTLRSIGRPPQR